MSSLAPLPPLPPLPPPNESGGNGAAPKPALHFKLTRHFSIACLIGVVIVMAVLVSFYRYFALAALKQHEARDNTNITQIFASTLWPRHAGYVKTASAIPKPELPQRPEVAQIREDVLRQMKGLLVVKVKIYNLDGLTVFSTDPAQIGEDKSANSGFLAAKSGSTVSEITFRDRFDAFEQVINDRSLVSSYVPIRPNPDAPVEGVMEVYSDVTAYVENLQTTTWEIVAVVLGSLSVLYFFLLSIVRRGERVIHAEINATEEVRAGLAAIVDAANDAIVSRDLKGRVLSWNRGAEGLFGYSAAEMVGRDISVLAPPALQHEIRIGQEMASNFAARSHDSARLTKDGRLIDVSISAAPIKDTAGRIRSVALIFRDITERKRSMQTQAQLAAIVETSNDAIVGRAPDDTIVSWNAAAERMFGWSANEALGLSFRSLLSRTPANMRQGRFELTLRGEAAPSIREDIRMCKDGSSIHVETTMSAVRNERGDVLFVSCIMRDVTEKLRAELHIEQLATKDPLTGLANRSTLTEQMNNAIARAARAQTQLVVMFVDLDHFKAVNDTLGHAAGDELLRECGKRLIDCVREVDIVARLGGDEFVVLLTDVTDTTIVRPIAERMLKLLTTPYQLFGHEAQASASVGICFYPADGSDTASLMKSADFAMYHAKERGRNNYQFYAAEMNQRMMQRLQLEQELRAAVENKEFVLHYQPQVSIATGEIQGAESLIRWQHPTRGLLPPAEFIAVAEETGLIVPIGKWILDHACRTIKTWRNNGVGIPYIVVNVSAAQLTDALVHSVRQALVKNDIEAGWLMLEITETMLMERVEEAISILRRIREMGIRIAMDDFGTGYSSLSILQRLPLDTLKIDRSFVSAIDDDANNARACAIIGAIIAIAKELNLSVVAEGVETTTQLAFLRTVDCDTYQGYLYSVPIDTTTLEIRYAAPVRSVLEDENGRAITMTTKVTLELSIDTPRPF